MIPVNNLSLKLNQNRKAIDRALAKVLDSGMLVLGSCVSQFEECFAKYIGVNDAIGVANGTDALEISLRAAGAGPTSLVATVANAGGYSTNAIMAVGAAPIYMDVVSDTHHVSYSEVERAIACGAGFVIVTHLYGQIIRDIEAITQLCKAKQVILLEDCAQAHGARLGSNYAGAFGDIAAFSFYPTKNLGCLGDGGLVATSNQEFAARARKLRQYGWASKYHAELPGGRNSRLDELQASVLLEFLPLLDSWNTRRREIADRYTHEITHPQIVKPLPTNESNVAHLYVIRVSDRMALQAYLKQQGVLTDIHYPIPDYQQQAYVEQFGDVNLPCTQLSSQEVLTLPCYPELSDDQIDRVINVINLWKK